LELLEGLQEQIVPSAQFSATLPPCLLSAFAKPFSPPVPQRGKPGGVPPPPRPLPLFPLPSPKGGGRGATCPLRPLAPSLPQTVPG
jgi:hypothetical protein